MSKGYDFDLPSSDGGLYLRLKEKGEIIKIRLGSEPVHQYKVWDQVENTFVPDTQNLSAKEMVKYDKDKERYKVSHNFIWKVLDKTNPDNVTAKLYSAPGTVYKQIRALVNDPEWEDIEQYDLKVTRTEESPANYYEVVPSPKPSAITKEQRAMLDKIYLPGEEPASPDDNIVIEDVDDDPLAGLDAAPPEASK